MTNNGSFGSCDSRKRLVPSCLHELHESNFRLTFRIYPFETLEFSAHVSGIIVAFLLIITVSSALILVLASSAP